MLILSLLNKNENYESVVTENLPRFQLAVTSLRSSLLYRNHRFSFSTRRFRNLSSITGATCIRRGKAAEERHKRADLTCVRTKISPAIVLDQFILGTFLASLFAFVFLYVLRQSSNHVNLKFNRTKKNSDLVVDQSDAVSTNPATEEEYDTDLIIVGAGVAGAALAHTLGKEGRRVHVIERDFSEQDRIVGELLQPGGYLKLIELGLEDCVKKIDAQRVLGYVLFKDEKHTKLSYPLETFDSDVAGRSFHNGRFVQRMREKAANLSNVRFEQGTVMSLLEENRTVKGVQYRTKEGNEFRSYAPLTIVCDGCLSKLRRSLCKSKVNVLSTFVGLVLENCELPLKPIHNLNDKETVSNYIESFYTLRKPVASTINTLASALYKVFLASSDEAKSEMREACFDYLSLGGVCSSGPIALLSGLNPSPLSLVLHFFRGGDFRWDNIGIMFPIIKAEGVRQMFFPLTIAAIYRTPPCSMMLSGAIQRNILVPVKALQ